jgi:hypothetical protein
MAKKRKLAAKGSKKGKQPAGKKELKKLKPQLVHFNLRAPKL